MSDPAFKKACAGFAHTFGFWFWEIFHSIYRVETYFTSIPSETHQFHRFHQLQTSERMLFAGEKRDGRRVLFSMSTFRRSMSIQMIL